MTKTAQDLVMEQIDSDIKLLEEMLAAKYEQRRELVNLYNLNKQTTKPTTHFDLQRGKI